MFISDTFLRPRSIPDMEFLSRSAFSASDSCDMPAALRAFLTRFPKDRKTRRAASLGMRQSNHREDYSSTDYKSQHIRPTRRVCYLAGLVSNRCVLAELP